MQRYFVQQAIDNRAVIEGEDAHHIQRVMRMKEADELIVVVAQQAFRAEITQLHKDSVDVQLLAPLERSVEMPVHVTIACGLPKGDKLDLVIQKATELGMTGFIPFEAERSIVKWDAKKWSKKQERFEKIAKEAAEQSHRTVIPTIHPIHNLNQLCEASNSYDYVWICDEEEAKKDTHIRFADHVKKVYDNKSILIVFGPEGGLARHEVDALVRCGASGVKLGPRILRAETAPLYALSALSYEFE